MVLSWPRLTWGSIFDLTAGFLRGECGPLTAGLTGDAAIESGGGCASIIVSARDDSELYGLLDRIQDVALHLISLNQIGSSSPAT